MSGPVDPTEFVGAFVAEAEDLVRSARTHLLAAESALRGGGTVPVRGTREVFRAVHTIKGLAAMVGVEPIVAVSHRMETLLRAAEQAGGKLDADRTDALLQGIEAIEQRLRPVQERRPVAVVPRALLERLDALGSGDGPAAAQAPAGELALDLPPALAAKVASAELEQLRDGLRAGRRALRVEFVPTPERAAAGLSITAIRQRAATVAEIVKVLPVSIPESADAPGGLAFLLLVLSSASDEAIAGALGLGEDAVRPLVADAAPPADALLEPDGPLGDSEALPVSRNFVRVDVARLDDAMDRLGALTVNRFRLHHAAAALASAGVAVRDLDQVLGETSRLLRDLRGALLRVRMVPVAEVLERLHLVVRGLRRETGKVVRLEIDVGRAELDKGVAERIFPAIVHIIRNAVDHAIEAPADRRAAGKPEEGLIRIEASERSNTQLELTVSDDGRGVDAAAVAARANRPVPQTDVALLDLLCIPGLSTRDTASTTSGRGMGMDIVRRVVVGELGGELLMRTSAGQGTALTLRVPLTISIIDAIAFECAGQRFVAPVSSIEELLDIEVARVVAPPGGGRPGAGPAVGLIERRGEAVPLVGLAQLFRLAEAGARGTKAVVVRRAAEAVAFVVDRMIGQHEVVVRPLEDPLVRVPGVSGTTDLGDGRPTLVLDLLSLVGAAA